MEEKIYYDNGDVKVTSTRVVTKKQTYVLKNISLVESDKKSDSSCLPAALLIIGLLIAIPGFYDLRKSYWAVIIGVLLFIAGIYLSKQTLTNYIVKITTNSGNSIAYTSYTKSEVDNVIDAINQAIIEN